MGRESAKSPVRSVGVEEELLLIDAVSARPVAVAGSIMSLQDAVAVPPGTASFDARIPSTLQFEVKQEQIEVISRPVHTLAELTSAIRAGRKRSDAAAGLFGARTVAMATAIEPLATCLVPVPRYEAMESQFGMTMRHQLSCGFHVHVGIESAEEGIAVLDRIRVWLPVLLALSANSPFWEGEDTGYASYRYQAWMRWPTTGPNEIFGSEAQYRATVEDLLRTGVPLDEGMMYFDARLSRHHPTIETRIADVCLDGEHAAVIAALVRGLVETAAREWRARKAPVPASVLQLRLASWRASKSGTEGDLIDPLSETPMPARVVVRALLEHVAPVLGELGEESEVARIVDDILTNGTGARRQRETFASTGSASAVIKDAVGRTHLAPSGVTA
ncbi:MAG: YbdK family carboxylate-amine ligase [Microbacteriaceae bacterium]|jgi:carboxylate-amine ligase|nr:YbdK family carboxylate-amine ligase [Microbacteriaceae bacterium]